MPWFIISSVTSTSMCSGMSAGQTFDLDLARDEVEHAALLLHAPGLALDVIGHRDRITLVHRDAVEVRVQQRVGNRIEQEFLHEHRRRLALETRG